MITAIEPDVKPLGRYTITETASLLGIHRNTLRNYIALGYITPQPKRDGVRSYRILGREIQRCWKYQTGK